MKKISYSIVIVLIIITLPIIGGEVIIRGYLTGSAWRDYQKGSAVSGITLPEGMKKDEKFPEPLFTPSTKAEHGEHDEAISEEEILKVVVPYDEKIKEIFEKIGLAHRVASNEFLVVKKDEAYSLVNTLQIQNEKQKIITKKKDSLSILNEMGSVEIMV